VKCKTTSLYFVLIVFLLLSFLSSISFIQVTLVKADEQTTNAASFFNMNLTEYWQTLNQHSAWDLEWYNVSLLEWVSVKSDLTAQRQYVMPDLCKMTLLFNASQTGDYRLTFGIDLRVKRYVQKLDQYQYELTYEGVSVIFDWSDVIGISGLVVTHGVKNVDGNDYFWCRMRRDNVPQGAYLEIDPSVNIKPLSKETYYPSSYNAVGSTTPVSGSVADLQADDGSYAVFRSYASANGTAINLGYSTASTTGSTTIESQIVGSLFTLSQNAWATQIMAYVGVTTAAKNAKCMIYRHSNLALMGTTVEISLPVATAWRTFTFSPYIWLPADEYIIDVWSATGSGNGVLYYATGTTNQGHIDPQTYGTVPNPLVPTSHNAFKYDVNCSLIPPSEYICDLEFTGTSNTETWLELIWGSDCSFTTDSVTATFQLYNYQTGSYPQSGDGFMSDTMGNVDVNKTQTITINPSDFRDASGNWKVKVKAVKSTNVQFDLKADFVDPTVIWTAVSVTSVHTCPLDTHTFVIAYHDDTNDDFSFQIYDTNGTQILAETDVDTTSGGTMDYVSVGVSAFNSTTFVIGWFDKTDSDATFAIYNITGSLLSGPTDVDTDVGTVSYCVQVSCFNSTFFVIAWYDNTDADATFAIYDSSSNLIAGPIDADETAGQYSVCFAVSVSTFNSTHFVIGWYDRIDSDATFAIYDSSGTNLTMPIDVDTAVGTDCYTVSVSTLNSTHFVIGWFDAAWPDYDVDFAVYDSTGTKKTGPIDADTDVGAAIIVQVAALNSTAFGISWYDASDFDLSYGTYLSDGTTITTNATDIESWPTAANTPFRAQMPCSQESGTGIKLYNDNWIIAYANTTTQAVWQAFMPNGTAWDGTIPAQGNGQDLTFTLSENLYPSANNDLTIDRAPISLKIGIPDGLTVNLNNYWVATAGSDMHITVLFVNNWLNYTIDSHGTQHIHNGTKPSYVYIDGVETTEGDGWSYTDGTTHLESTYNASLQWSGQNLEFSLSQAILAFAYNLLSKGLAFQSSSMINPSSIGYLWKAIGFLGTNTILSSVSTTMLNAFGFLTSGVISFFSSLLKAVELGFQPSVSIVPSSTNYFSKAIGFQIVNTAQSFGAVTMQKALGFLSTGSANIYSWFSKGMELAFTPTDILHIFTHGTLGKETATILYEVSDLAKLFSSLSFNMAKGFSNYDPVQSSTSLIQNKAIGFNVDGVVRLFSDLSIGIEKAFSNFGTINPFSYLTINKALGFFNYGQTQSSGSMTQNKAVQFSVDGLIRLFSDASIGIGRLFNTFETINPFASLGLGKELSFNVYGLPQFFDNLSIGKSIRITMFELSGLLQPFANALATFQITVIVPATNLPLVLGGFAVVMVFVCLALVLDVQNKKPPKPRGQSNS